MVNRRTALASMAGAAFMAGTNGAFAFTDPLVPARARVIVDNDFSGDPDDLFQMAHHLMSPSVEIPLIVGSHLSPTDGFDNSKRQAANAVARVHELLGVMGLEGAKGAPKVVQGSNVGITDRAHLPESAATAAIVAEAMREDDRPLYYCVGGGLTELALAWLAEPKIAQKMTVVWIGGPEYADLAVAPPGSEGAEYNLNIDIPAAQIVFGESDLPLWQVPRDTYRQMLMSRAEMITRLKPQGKLGAYLAGKVEGVMALTKKYGMLTGETYILGDSPLVTLTALQASFQPDPSSSAYVVKKAPKIADDGSYLTNAKGREIRVYTRIDVRLTFDDLIAKLKLQAMA